MSIVKSWGGVLSQELMLVFFNNDETIAKNVSQEGAEPLRLRKVVAFVNKKIGHKSWTHYSNLVTQDIEGDEVLSRVLFGKIEKEIAGGPSLDDECLVSCTEEGLAMNVSTDDLCMFKLPGDVVKLLALGPGMRRSGLKNLGYTIVQNARPNA